MPDTTVKALTPDQKMQAIVSLCRRRAFIFVREHALGFVEPLVVGQLERDVLCG